MADRLTPDQLVDKLSFVGSAPFATESIDQRARAALNSGQVTEYWKYTPIADFVAGLADVAPVRPDIGGLAQPGVSLSSWMDASHSHPLGPSDESSVGRFPLADLALLISGDLLVLRIQQSPAEPIVIVTGDGLTVPVLIDVDPGVNVRLVERADGAQFGNQSIYLNLGEGATVEHASAALQDSASQWSLTQVRLDASSHYTRQQYQRGGLKRRTETQILLDGREACAEITGAYVVDAGTHLDQQLVVEHRAPATWSRQKFHGIGAGKGTAIFNGRIHIHPGAPGADAALSNRNLALHPDAIINTKPELEIYTDDVKCAHGATVGRLSEDSLFYLQSRGLGPERARQILCRAFVTECMEGELSQLAERALLRGWADPAGDP